MWSIKLQNSSKLNRPALKLSITLFLAVMTLSYPFAVYFFHDKLSPSLFVMIMASVLLARFIVTSATHKSIKTAFVYGGVILAILTLSSWDEQKTLLYYPVIINVGMALIFTTSLFTSQTLIEYIARFQEPALPPSGIYYTRQVTKIWSLFCFTNATLSYFTVAYGTLEVWTLYNGFISYILMGSLFLGEFLFRKIYKKKATQACIKNYTQISKLTHLSQDYWSKIWKNSGQEEHLQNYSQYISTLFRKVKDKNPDRVFLISNDRSLFLAGFLSTLAAGKTLVIPHTDAKGFLKDLLNEGDMLLSDNNDLDNLCPNTISLNKIKSEKGAVIDPINSEDAHIIFYTSGSTGEPKAIRKTLTLLENEILSLQKTWPKYQGEFFSTVPHHHIYGLLFSVLWPACIGLTMHRKTIAYWEELPETFSQDSYIISSPSHLGRFPSNFQKKATQVFSSGGPLPFETAKAAQSILGQSPTEVYGSTETGGIAYRTQTSPDELWSIFADIEIKTDSKSLLHIKSPYISCDGFFKTEDKISLKNKGQFTLIGRADRIVKIEGKRLSLNDLEKRMLELDIIDDVRTLMMTSPQRDEIVAVVLLNSKGKKQLQLNGKRELSKSIKDSLRAYFDLTTIPRRWRFVDAFPLNNRGKIIDASLRDLFEERGSR